MAVLHVDEGHVRRGGPGEVYEGAVHGSRLTSSGGVSQAILGGRYPVCRVAAAGLASMEPKFPWPLARGTIVEKVRARRARASHTTASPCGWPRKKANPHVDE